MIGAKARAFAGLLVVAPLGLLALTHALWAASLLRTVVALGAAAIAYDWIVRKPIYNIFFNPLQQLPSPDGEVFGLGHVVTLLKRPTGPDQERWVAKHADARGMLVLQSFMYTGMFLVMTNPDTATDVLVKRCYDFEKRPGSRRLLAHLIGEGLVVAEGQEHRVQRKAVWPAFQGHHISALVPLFWQKAGEYADKLVEGLSSSSPVSIGPTGNRATLDIIGVAALDKDFGSLHNPDNEMANSFSNAANPQGGSARAYIVAGFILPIWALTRLPWKTARDINQSIVRIRQITLGLLADKKKVQSEEDKSKRDIVSLLIQSGSFNDNELVDQFLTFLAAGHETTATALQWTAYLLATHPNIQDRLREELTSVIGSTPLADLTADTLEALPFLNAVCQETLRIWPPVQLTGRVASRDTTINGHFVPKGTNIVIPIAALNRSTAVWGADAGTFNPDRWLGSDSPQTRTAGFATFLHGPRSCIGQDFSRQELKCLVAALVLKARLRVANPGTKLETVGAITVKPKGIKYFLEGVK